MKRHPTGELSRSGCVPVVLGALLALVLSDTQMLDPPQLATPSQLPDDGDTLDVPEVPGMPGGDTEELKPKSCHARGLLPEWDAFGLHDQLIRALCHQSLTKPTPIQVKALPLALRGRDVVGVAETVRSRLVLFLINTHIGTGVRENAGIRITRPTQTPIAGGEISEIKNPQGSARVDPSPHSRTCTPDFISFECLPK